MGDPNVSQAWGLVQETRPTNGSKTSNDGGPFLFLLFAPSRVWILDFAIIVEFADGWDDHPLSNEHGTRRLGGECWQTTFLLN